MSKIEFTLTPESNERLGNLCGQLDEHLQQIERQLGVHITNRGYRFQLKGDKKAVELCEQLLRRLYDETEHLVLSPENVHLALQQSGLERLMDVGDSPVDIVIKTKRGLIKPRGNNQAEYLRRILSHDINFGIGPAGTGKTYLAVACAVEALERDGVRRILLVRPAVEAGERLGFLPGDLAQKIDPYLRPLYDALYEMLGFERVAKLVERNVIEVAPLAYMRGRTLNHSFIILDEAQNTTSEQMKMFLTRIGYGSTVVVTGDITQIDLPRGVSSGLKQACDLLANVKGISFTKFEAKDVIRHSLVQQIVEAYEQHQQEG